MARASTKATEERKEAVNPIHPNLPTVPFLDFIQEMGTKSNAIRKLASMNVPTAAIAKYLDIRYQHARNVLSRPLKANTQAAAPNTGTQSGSANGGKATKAA